MALFFGIFIHIPYNDSLLSYVNYRQSQYLSVSSIIYERLDLTVIPDWYVAQGMNITYSNCIVANVSNQQSFGWLAASSIKWSYIIV
jgi:hypothetical protein